MTSESILYQICDRISEFTLTWQKAFWTEIIRNTITVMGTQRECGQNMTLGYGHCVKSNEKQPPNYL